MQKRNKKTKRVKTWSRDIKGNEVLPYIFISLYILLAFSFLYLLRFLDDDMFKGWLLLFETADVRVVYTFLIIGLLIAYLFSKSSVLERNPAASLFFLSFFFSMILWREPEINIDASRYFTYAKYMGEYGVSAFIREWGGELKPMFDLPMVPFLHGLIFKFLGESRIYIQIFTTTLFSSTVVLTYLIGKKLWKNNVGVNGGFLLLGIPYLITQVPLMLVDVPTMFFLTLSIFACIKAVESDDIKWTALTPIAIFMTFFSKFTTWPMLSVIPVIFLVYLKQGWSRIVLYRGIVIGILSSALIGVVAFLKHELLLQQIDSLMDYQFQFEYLKKVSYRSIFLFQIHPFVTLFASYSIYDGIRKNDVKYLTISLPMLLVLLMGVKVVRYMIPVFPMFTLMASYGLREMVDKEHRKFLVSSIVASSLVIVVFAYLPFYNSLSYVNLKNAGEYLDSTDVDGIEVFTEVTEEMAYNPAFSVPLLNLYTDKKIYYDTSGISPPPFELIKDYWTRFTWEYTIPRYYTTASKSRNKAIVVIFENKTQIRSEYLRKKLEGYELSKVFDTTITRIYVPRTLVEVYLPESED